MVAQVNVAWLRLNRWTSRASQSPHVSLTTAQLSRNCCYVTHGRDVQVTCRPCGVSLTARGSPIKPGDAHPNVHLLPLPRHPLHQLPLSRPRLSSHFLNPATAIMSSNDYYGGDGAHGQQQGYGNYPAQPPQYGGQQQGGQQYGQQQPHDQYGQGHSPYPQQQVSAIARVGQLPMRASC